MEHIMQRAECYIGTTSMVSQSLFCYDEDFQVIQFRTISFVPGLYKIFDEILRRATDNRKYDNSMTRLEVTINNNLISVWNNGEGIPVEMNSEYGVYIPQLIVGEISGLADEVIRKSTGGRYGFGAVINNIFCKEFTIETSHSHTRSYKQIFRNNFTVKDPPELGVALDSDFTLFSFKPDLSFFNMTLLDNDILSLFTKRVYDIAACNPGVEVILNGKKINISNFRSYIKLFLPLDNFCIFEKVNDQWEVGVSITDGEFQQVSFVNNYCTFGGGSHVDYVVKQIVKVVKEKVKKRYNGDVKSFQVKNYLWVFVKAKIENPSFSTQICDSLTNRQAGFECVLSEEFLKNVLKTSIVSKVVKKIETKAAKKVEKRKEKLNIPKLDDANNAGGEHAEDCTLMIVEGDSAKTQAVVGLGVVGRDDFGAFPLRGKLINVRAATTALVMKNVEIEQLIKMIGLKFGVNYKDTKSLRYGRIMIMTDQDHDGSHIKSLFINFIHYFWPSLLKIPGFITEFVTPIVKVTKSGKTSYFYAMNEFKEWLANQGSVQGYNIKYLKGLGSSTAAEFKQFFSNIDNHRINFVWNGQQDGALDLAFSKSKADERKQWLAEYKPGSVLEHNRDISCSDLVNKELILFSIADCERSIPSIIDGLKPSQRKVMHACFKRNITRETKVIQLAGHVMELCAYHHGEVSLNATTVGLAQDFVGSNNINLLFPGGCFGSRLMGGADAASPRYIFTKLSDITRLIFRAEDDSLLSYLVDYGQTIEPRWFVPVIPMVLVNGCSGIGTGWSTQIPCFNPRDIISNLKRLIDGEQQHPMHPWYAGFKGKITLPADNKRYSVSGVWKRLSDRTLEITELPVGTWTQPYKEFLTSMVNPEDTRHSLALKNIQQFHTDTSVHFIIESVDDLPSDDVVERSLKLTSSLSIANMCLFDSEGRIRQWASATEILEHFYIIRLQYYDKRKDHLVNIKREEWKILHNKVRFIHAIVSRELVVGYCKKDEIIQELRYKNFDSFPSGIVKRTKRIVGDDVIVDSESEEEEGEGYGYLLSMPLWNLTHEKIQALERQRDEKNEELNILLATSPKELWERDLGELEIALDARDDAQHEATKKVKLVKKKVLS